jgi:hypothetical protein
VNPDAREIAILRNYIVGDLEPSAAELGEVLAVVITPAVARHSDAGVRPSISSSLHDLIRQGESMTGDTDVWRVRAAEFRRIAKTSEEAERERKMLVLAAKADERAVALDREAELSEG